MGNGVTAHLDNFEAASEFWAGINVTCGQRAFSVLQHVKNPALALNGPEIVQLYDDMRAKGYSVAGGTTMSELVDYFSRFGGLEVEYTNGYGSSWDAIHQTLLDHAGRDGAVIEVELAYNLPDNEAGVHRHYIAIGAIDPVKGYLVANGDCKEALAAAGGHGKIVPTQWVDRLELARAVPSACAIVRNLPHVVENGEPAPAPVPQPQPQPQPAPQPAPVYFDQGNIEAFRAELQGAIQAAQQQLAVLQKALASLPIRAS